MIKAFIQKKKEADGTETEYVNYKKLRNDSKVKIVFLGNNKHKDEVFSFRFTEVGGGSNKDFMIESETTKRNKAIVYGEPRFKGADRAVVPTSIRFQNGSSVAISYIMQLKGSEWTAYDMIVVRCCCTSRRAAARPCARTI